MFLKKITILFLLLSASLLSKAQITLEGRVKDDLQYVKFSQAGEKYVKLLFDTIKVYNLDCSIYKAIIPINNYSTDYLEQNLFISDNLFNSDSKLEYVSYYRNKNTGVDQIRIYDENNTLLFQRDSATYALVNTIISEDNLADAMFFKTSTGWKMKLAINFNGFGLSPSFYTEVYSLPGSAIVTNTVPSNLPFNISNPYPNPTSGEARIDFKLPSNVSQGEIQVFDAEGRNIKTLQVDNTFGNVLLNYSGLPSGTYYYVIKAGGNVSETKKVILIP